MSSFPPFRAVLMQGSPASAVTSDGLLSWYICVCLVATVSDQCLAVVGFMGLEAGGLELDATCGLGHEYMFDAVAFLRHASDTERAKLVSLFCGCVFLLMCVAAGGA